MEIVKERSRSSSSMLLFIWVPLEVVVLLLCLAAPTTSLPCIGKALEPEGAPEGEAQRLQQEQPFPIDNESLFVDISNNMEAGDSNSVISVDCVAKSSTREPLDVWATVATSTSAGVSWRMASPCITRSPSAFTCTRPGADRALSLSAHDAEHEQVVMVASGQAAAAKD
ncbi:hypothetical protein AXG93_1619s1010 [Marchantia polymorpha subsp. ruderalis]|uniref:Ig-like domain-containing protein n=1 Tax=Marchantia polymorpha subsp. ruderalis TaxID=1480154 RepID=A0A176VNW1_MARPO|nr:hypothetical protein AXG93_1619s1010 [Marchantia polymorpha subsp. ruderalis]